MGMLLLGITVALLLASLELRMRRGGLLVVLSSLVEALPPRWGKVGRLTAAVATGRRHGRASVGRTS